ncbi:YdeI/OmpD-associated family protein [Pedobacter faecalis]|uniref:YdeI/OmpD-associated family protein n=1 Tax=Pedobacter faecalis TaxID=3041495 RepID=UPI00254F5E78|nr:YdeI/OmpD-associated family protein [Pedobacter sp. ELA7]
MITLKTEIERYGEMGEKTGWSYVFIPETVANQIKPGCRKSFRIKGSIDQVIISGMATVPVGDGNFILALKSSLRKQLKKEAGASVILNMEEDRDFKIEVPEDLELCLSDEPELMERFMALPKSHRNWYINWLNSAKTESTRTKRLVKIVSAMHRKLSFGEMMREDKQAKL